MRRIISLAAVAALCLSLLVPATAAASPPTPTMTATACRADSHTIHVVVSWSSLAVTGGEIAVEVGPFEHGPDVIWNQKGKHGTHVEDIEIGNDIADLVTVNLYNAKIQDPNYFVQVVIGIELNDAEELLPC
jgi:hypothetical protein